MIYIFLNSNALTRFVFVFFPSAFYKLYYFLSARLLDGVWLNTIDRLSLFIWIYSFCHIVFAGKKKVFTTFFACFENIDNITENYYIIHHSLMEIEDLKYIFEVVILYIKSEYWGTTWMNSFAKSVYIEDSDHGWICIWFLSMSEDVILFLNE